jgi:D-alanyl-D-alanine carboxypeptidase
MSNRLTNNIFLVFLMFIATIFYMQFSYAECGQNINEGIQKIIDQDRIKFKIPGIQVSISCPGENTPRNFVSGTTTQEKTIPVKPDNLFQIGSETKSFTATIILKLEANGLLSINDPIGKWLPQYPAWKNITIKQLLNHTSGVVDYFDTDEFTNTETETNFQKQWSSEELVNLVINVSPYFAPGQGFHYSNTNYVLAGMIISVITGKSVEEEMQTLLFEPLLLSNTYYLPFPYSNDIMQRMAHGYYPVKIHEPYEDSTDYNMSEADAAGAIVSTSEDTAIWLKKLFTSNVLPEKQRNEMMTLVDMDNGQPIARASKKSGYGLGILRHVVISGVEIWGHDGSTFGYNSNMFLLKCNNVYITTIINLRDEHKSSNLLNDLITYIQNTDTSKSCPMGTVAKNNFNSMKLDKIRKLT